MRRNHLVPLLALLLGLPSAASLAQKQQAGRQGRPRRVQRVDSQNPLGVFFAIDQSASTARRRVAGGMERSLATAISDTANLTVESLLAYSQDGEDEASGLPKFKPYFHVSGVGYSTGTRPLFAGGHKLYTMDELFAQGSLDPQEGKYVWVKPVGVGNTHMGEGLQLLVPHVKEFVTRFPGTHAPIVLNVTDGEPRGGQVDPLEQALALQRLKTRAGRTLMMNLHFSGEGAPLIFPESVDDVPEEIRPFAQLLFDMSSPLPKAMAAMARKRLDIEIGPKARAMTLNADGMMLPTLFEIGTVQAQQDRE